VNGLSEGKGRFLMGVQGVVTPCGILRGWTPPFGGEFLLEEGDFLFTVFSIERVALSLLKKAPITG